MALWNTCAAILANSSASSLQMSAASATVVNFAKRLQRKPSLGNVSFDPTTEGMMECRVLLKSWRWISLPIFGGSTGWKTTLRSSRATMGVKQRGHFAAQRSSRPPAIIMCCIIPENPKTWPQGVIWGAMGGESRVIGHFIGVLTIISTWDNIGSSQLENWASGKVHSVRNIFFDRKRTHCWASCIQLQWSQSLPRF